MVKSESIAVRVELGMRIERNRFSTPDWFQRVGRIDFEV
jgi:hypothetical protein